MLRDFLCNVARLVCQPDEFKFDATGLPELIPDALNIPIPVFPPGGSVPPFGSYGSYAQCVRPKNAEGVDGIADFTYQDQGGTPKNFSLRVESKNHKGGLQTDVFKDVMKRVGPNVNLLIVITSKIPPAGFISVRQSTAENKDLVKKGEAEKQLLSLDELYANACSECKHEAFDAKDRTKLRVVAVDQGGAKYVKLAGKEQKGLDSKITLMVVIFVADIGDEAVNNARKRKPVNSGNCSTKMFFFSNIFSLSLVR